MSLYVTTKQYNWFQEALQNFLRVHEIGQIVNLETGFELDLASGEKVRIPDLGIVLNDNPVPIQGSDRRYHGTFDLCIEAISDSTRKIKERDTVVKKKEYAEAKVKEYYMLDGTGIETAFFRLNQQGKYEEIKPINGIIQSEVLPGFQFRIRDLYEQPKPKEMATDHVYRGFIMLDYQAEKEKADFAMQRAHEENLRADEEKRRADEKDLKAEEERRRAEEAIERAEEEKFKAEEEKRRADEAIERVYETERRAEEEKRRAEEAIERVYETERRADEERRRADEERRRAEEEKRRAEEAIERAERLAAKLKELGIELD